MELDLYLCEAIMKSLEGNVIFSYHCGSVPPQYLFKKKRRSSSNSLVRLDNKIEDVARKWLQHISYKNSHLLNFLILVFWRMRIYPLRLFYII